MANRKPFVIGCIALAVVFVGLAVVYFTTTAQDLPSWLPGHEAGSTRHHVKHGVAMITLALACGVGVWMLSLDPPLDTAAVKRSGGSRSMGGRRGLVDASGGGKK